MSAAVLAQEAARDDDFPRTLSWTGMSHAGKVRKNNEDTFLAITFDAQTFQYLGKYGDASLDQGDFVFAVGDGMGGAKAGEFASKIAIEKITRLLPKGFRAQAAGMSSGFGDLFEELFEEIHKALLYLGSTYPECEGMGSTLSLGWFSPGWMYFCHIGDSRIYYLPATGGLKQITHDNTHVGWLLRQGKINEREARAHPGKNSLQKALGADHQFIEPQVGAVSCEPGDRFLLCSDGVVDGLWDRQIEQLLCEPDENERTQRPAERLVHKAVDISGRDNTTAIVVEMGE